MSVDRLRDWRTIRVTESLLTQFLRRAETVHQSCVRVTKCMETVAGWHLDTEHLKQGSELTQSLRRPDGGQRRMLPISRTLCNALDLYLQSSARQRGGTDFVFVTREGKPLRRNTLRYNFVRICARAGIRQEHGYSPTPGIHDLRHTFAVHVLEAWVREGKDLRQKLPVLSGYMGHVLLKSTELYLRLVPDRFMKPLSTLQQPRKSQRGIVGGATDLF